MRSYASAYLVGFRIYILKIFLGGKIYEDWLWNGFVPKF